jgi:concanavalin A-like lectin/glucanase superfamily protein
VFKQPQNHISSLARPWLDLLRGRCAALTTRVALIATVVVTIAASQALAVPVAYWRFGDDGTTPVDGDWITPSAGRTEIKVDADPVNPPAYIPGYDSTGNGNDLYTWDDNGTGHNYRAHVASATVGGNSNEWSIQNNGGYPASFTWSAGPPDSGYPGPSGTDLETITPSQWTIEATIKPTAVDGAFRTFVGREGNDVLTVDPNSAPLYFQITNENRFRINFTDATGSLHLAESTDIDILAHQWYHVAATSDGNTLSLYVDSYDGSGYQLAASADLTGSADSAMIDPGLDANGDTWGWTVGRGRYGSSDDPDGDHGDRFYGYVDEVRISDNAIAPAALLFAGQNLNHGPRLEINRADGTFNLVNLQSSFDLVGYSITSASGALDPNNWFSITDNQDAGNGGGFDPDNTWNIVTSTNNELSETELVGDGGDLGSVVLGLANAWTESRFEDLQITIDELLPDFSVSTYSVPVLFTGGLGATAARSDLDLDGDVDSDDWIKFKTHHLTDLSGQTVAVASTFGDIDNDLDSDFNDFRLFQTDYDGANGRGALATLIAAVPEPSTGLLLLIGCLPLGLRRR